MIEILKAIAAVSAPLFVSAAYSMGLICFGLCCLNCVGLSRPRWRVVPLSIFLGVAFSLGSGLVATLWLLLSFVGLFEASTVSGVLFVAVLCSAVVDRALWWEITGAIPNGLRELRDESWSWQLISVALFGLIAAHAVSTLHPAKGDSVAFYLPWARVMADTGRVIRLPGYEAFSDIWTIAEIQIAAVIMISNDFAARSLPFWHSVFAAFLLWGASRAANLGFRGGILAVAMLFTSSAVSLITWDGKTDLVALPMGLAALIVASLKNGKLNKRHSIVTGLLVGVAVAAKLSYLPILGVGILLLSCWRVWRAIMLGDQDWKEKSQAELTSFIIIGAAAALVLAPQMFRNWVASGEPFAPLYYFKNIGFGLEQDWFAVGTTRRILLTYPLALTYGIYWGQHGNISILALAFLPLCLVFSRPLSKIFFLLTLAGTSGVVVWALLRTSTLAPRYILCSLALMFIFVAGAAARASYLGSRLTRSMIVLTTSYAIWGAIYSLGAVLPASISYASGGDVDNYSNDDAFAVARVLNASAPIGSRIALVNWYRYPLRADLLECAIGVQDIPAANLQGYYINGARYLVLDLSTRKSEVDQILRDVPPWLKLKQIYKGPQYSAFEMVATDGAPKVGFECKRNKNVWQRAAID